MSYFGKLLIAAKRYKELIFILILAIPLKFGKLQYFFYFDYDQEVVANSAYEFWVNHKISLIGQELSFKGFFLGPLHNWIGFVPYKICSLKPDCFPYFYIFLSLLTTLVFYKFLQKIISNKCAVIGSGLFVFSMFQKEMDVSGNSNYFLFICSIVLAYTLYQYLKGKDFYLIAGSFIAGIAVINFNPVFIFSSLAYFISAIIFRRKQKTLIVIAASIAFLINSLPLVIFNLRHQNILFYSLQEFLKERAGDGPSFSKFPFLAKDLLLNYYSHYIFKRTEPIFLLFTLIIFFVGLVIILRQKDRYVLFFPILIALTLAGFFFYKGPVFDYYFQQTLVAFTIIFIFAVRKNYLLFIISSTLIITSNLHYFNSIKFGIDYLVKKEAVKYIVETSSTPFSVRYELPVGYQTGYAYLLKIYNANILDSSKYFHVIVYQPQNDFFKEKYYFKFGNKDVNIKDIGYLHVVSVK